MNSAITRGSEFDHGGQPPSPVDSFSDSHAIILAGLRRLATLPALAQAARRARDMARDIVTMMDDAVLEHHKQEEEDLFPAVLRSAEEGEERDNVKTMVWRLTDEHREIEKLWRALRPEVVRVAAGRSADLPHDTVNVLVSAYLQHARAEERSFLPLAHEILGRNGNHMDALGLSLHLRHAVVPPPYI